MGHNRFFLYGLITEGLLVLLALVLAYFFLGAPVALPMSVSGATLSAGLAGGGLPIALLYGLWRDRGHRFPGLWVHFQGIIDRLRPVLASSIIGMSLPQIVVLSAAAGFGEELLFRGVLQPLFGIVAASLIFGALHALNLLYFLMATAMGLYLGGLLQWTGNLIPAMVGHGVYDVFAFLLLRSIYRTENQPGTGVHR